MGEAKDGQGCLGCPQQKWASYQEILLSMTESTVGEIAGKINSDPTWDDPVRIAQLVESVDPLTDGEDMGPPPVGGSRRERPGSGVSFRPKMTPGNPPPVVRKQARGRRQLGVPPPHGAGPSG
jgi:hypothetical protein